MKFSPAAVVAMAILVPPPFAKGASYPCDGSCEGLEESVYPYADCTKGYSCVTGVSIDYECGVHNGIQTLYDFASRSCNFPGFATCYDQCPCYKSCQDYYDIKVAAGGTPKEGIFNICPTGDDENTYQAYCSFLDGQGWMLFFAYNHPLNSKADRNFTLLPTDPDTGHSHINLQDLSKYGYTQDDVLDLRFYCQATNHNRTVHFKTNNTGVIEIAFTGDQSNNDPSHWNTGFTTLANHTGNLPAAANDVGNYKEYGLTDEVFKGLNPYEGGYYSKWTVGYDDDEWGCDGDQGLSDRVGTLHNVWVRLNPPTCYASCQDAYDTQDAAGKTPVSGTVLICPTGEISQNFLAYCSFLDGEGWMLFFAYNHPKDSTAPLNSNLLPTDPDTGHSHINLQDLSKYGYTQNDVLDLRFYCHSSTHNRKVHFKTNNAVVKEIAFTGDQSNNDASHWNTGFTTLADHTGNLPAATNDIGRVEVEKAGLWEHPFLAQSRDPFSPGGSYWSVAVTGDFFACDDEVQKPIDTLHNVWVRLNPPSCYASCQDAHDIQVAAGKTPVSSTVSICPTGEISQSFWAHCDFLDGEGWMLIYAYQRDANAKQAPTYLNKLPTDPNGNSHAHVQDLASYGYTVVNVQEVRFYCETLGHDRKIHFRTSDAVVRKMAYTGKQDGNAPSHWKGFTPLSNHTGTLPGSTNFASTDSPEGAFLDDPFEDYGKSTWRIGGSISFCDGYSGGDSLYRVWVRIGFSSESPSATPSQAPSLSAECHLSCLAAYISGRVASGLYYICPTGDFDNKFTAWCSQEEGGGWMLTYAYKHTIGHDDPIVKSTLPPTDPFNGYSHVHIQDLSSYGYTKDNIQEVRFYCQTAEHPRKIHFKTSNAVVREIAYSGNQANNSASHWNTGYALLSGHNATLPQGAGNGIDSAEGGFWAFPFMSVVGEVRAWSIGDFYSCDDYSGAGGRSTHTTLHQVWVRMDFPSAAPSMQPSSSPSTTPSDSPSDSPSAQPSSIPSHPPSDVASDAPSVVPSSPPSAMPSLLPSKSPSAPPSMQLDSETQAPSTSPTWACPNPLVPVTRTYYFVFSGSADNITPTQVTDAFKEAYAKLPKSPCSPVLISLAVASRASRKLLPDLPISQLPQLTGVTTTIEDNLPPHRRLQSRQVNVEVISTQIADTPIFDSSTEEDDFIVSFNDAIQASHSGASVASLTNSAVPSMAPSTAPSSGNCCLQKAWGDFETRQRCPIDNWACLCPGSECCEVCRSTMGGRMLEGEEEQSDMQKDSNDASGESCHEEDQCIAKDGAPGFHLHRDQNVDKLLKGGGKVCVSSCVPVEAVIEMIGDGWTCGSCEEKEVRVA